MARVKFPAGEAGQFPVFDEGIYKLKISNPKLAYARGSGAATIECYLIMQAGKNKGERLYHQYSLQDQAIWKLKMDMRALGLLPAETYPEDKEFELEDEDIVAMLADAEGEGSIFTDMYKNSPRSKLAVPGFLTPEQVKERTARPAVAGKPTTPAARGIPEAAEPF